MRNSQRAGGRKSRGRKSNEAPTRNESRNKPAFRKNKKSDADSSPSESTKKRDNQNRPGFRKTEKPGRKSTPKEQVYSNIIRLNKFIANAGICSRRDADDYIIAGSVTVNGKVVTELGTKVSPDDNVRFDGQRLNPEKKVYLLMNKPKGFATTLDDPHADKTVMSLIKNACPERIYPVGRLDKNTTGVLLFTNDGDMAKKLTHPKYRHKKIYQISLDKPVSIQHLTEIAEGFELDDGFISADAISYVDKASKTDVGIEIHSGRNRIVRRIFEHFEYRVRKLDRVYFAGLTKKNLPRGKWRFLTDQEVIILKMTK